MEAHGISYLLTFNTADFQRYTSVHALHPEDVPQILEPLKVFNAIQAVVSPFVSGANASTIKPSRNTPDKIVAAHWMLYAAVSKPKV
jgi:hypothetical protein